MIRESLVLVSLIPCLVLGARASLAGPMAATEQVRIVLDRVMEIQTRPDLQGESHRMERAYLARQLIADNFLISDIARESVKDHWDRISQKQRDAFQSLFTAIFHNTYTRLVLKFVQSDTVEYQGDSAEGKGALVRTVIKRAYQQIPVDYHLIQKGARWYIRDVEIDGVSIVENYRNAFRRVMMNGSFDALLKNMSVQRLAIEDDL